jgi:hypothetical protein
VILKMALPAHHPTNMNIKTAIDPRKLRSSNPSGGDLEFDVGAD